MAGLHQRCEPAISSMVVVIALFVIIGLSALASVRLVIPKEHVVVVVENSTFTLDEPHSWYYNDVDMPLTDVEDDGEFDGDTIAETDEKTNEPTDEEITEEVVDSNEFRLVRCSSDTQVGERCELHIAELRPTQFTVGLQEVYCKTRVIEESPRPNQTHPYPNADDVPIVIGPDGMYQVDRHHLTRAIYESTTAEPYLSLSIVVVANWKNTTNISEFWSRMLQHGYAWLVDEKGNDGLHPRTLPRTIAHTINDPYRTLSFLVRKSGGYKKTEKLYQDSIWANVFRERLKLNTTASRTAENSEELLVPWEWCDAAPYSFECFPDELDQLHRLLPEAFAISQLPEMSHLPGYTIAKKPFRDEPIKCTDTFYYFSDKATRTRAGLS